MEYLWGSLKAAYISATSSANSATKRFEDRSAASPVMAPSITQHASNSCEETGPCWSAEIEAELGSSFGVPNTYVPEPWQTFNTPIIPRNAIPARRLERLTFSRWANSRSGGSWSPGRNRSEEHTSE